VGPFRLSTANTIAPGATVRHGYFYPTTDPNGQTIGDWKGPQQGAATPEQLLTGSNQVNAVAQGFDVADAGRVWDVGGITYTVDVGCEDVLQSDAFGEYELWVFGWLP
jgi:hypothetical protein